MIQELRVLGAQRVVHRLAEAMVMAMLRRPATSQDGQPHKEATFAGGTCLPQLSSPKDLRLATAERFIGRVRRVRPNDSHRQEESNVLGTVKTHVIPRVQLVRCQQGAHLATKGRYRRKAICHL
jgi:hypothetical protein